MTLEQPALLRMTNKLAPTGAVSPGREIETALDRIESALLRLRPAPGNREHIEAFEAVRGEVSYLRRIAVAAREAETGLPEPNPQPLDVSKFLRGFNRDWVAVASSRGFRLTVSFEATAPETLLVDQAILRRLLDLMIGGALGGDAPGSVNLRAAADEDGSPCFEIEDQRPMGGDGAGGDMRALSPLVRRLSAHLQIGPAGRGDGRVARLRLSPDLVMDEAAGPPLPQAAPPAVPPPPRSQPAPNTTEAEPPQAALPDLGGMRILMAEDNLTNQLVAGQMLQSMNAVVTIASDGAEAIEVLDAGDFDMLLIDIEMPRVSGLDVIRHVRALPDARARLPLVALTAYAMREHREKIAELGADGLIAKPILGIAEFGTEILSYFGRRNPGPFQRAAPIPTDGPLVDPDIYSALSDAIGAEGMAELLSKVEEDLRSVAEGIATGISRPDYTLLRSKTHILISVAGAIGAVGVQKLAEELNALAHRGPEAAKQIALLGTQTGKNIADLIGFVAARRTAG